MFRKNHMSLRHLPFALLSLGLVATMLYAIATSAENPEVDKEAAKAPLAGPFQFECWIQHQCGNLPLKDFAWPGEPADTECEAKALALSAAQVNCKFSCWETPNICCTDTNPTGDPCIEPPEYVPFQMQATDRLQRPFRLRCEFFGVGANGSPLYAASLPTGPEYSLEQAWCDAWEEFLPQVGQNLGLVEGTLRKRVAQATIYRCYTRVQSKHDNTLYDQQVEAQGYTLLEATRSVQSAANRLKSLLRILGHTDVDIKGGVDFTVEVNTLANASKQTPMLRHQCETGGGWTIIAARRGRSEAVARAAAREAATLIADDYGGAISCQDLSSVDEGNRTTAASGCVGCDGAAADDDEAKE